MPMLNAEVLAAPARVGASPARVYARAMSAGWVVNPASPRSGTRTVAARRCAPSGPARRR
ncbi:hypothetical protein NKH77_33565 [Streptomyces sp. M19]